MHYFSETTIFYFRYGWNSYAYEFEIENVLLFYHVLGIHQSKREFLWVLFGSLILILLENILTKKPSVCIVDIYHLTLAYTLFVYDKVQRVFPKEVMTETMMTLHYWLQTTLNTLRAIKNNLGNVLCVCLSCTCCI